MIDNLKKAYRSSKFIKKEELEKMQSEHIVKSRAYLELLEILKSDKKYSNTEKSYDRYLHINGTTVAEHTHLLILKIIKWMEK